MTLRSRDPTAHPSVVFNHLEAPQDMQDMIDGVRLTRTLIHQQAWDKYRGVELTPGSSVVSNADITASLRQKTGIRGRQPLPASDASFYRHP
ncbi:MAG: hypothetical protein JWN62_3347 [Acidimicrobiales bacterium]|nr:hypothetical protein [Acidimicrobiales bacterium]